MLKIKLIFQIILIVYVFDKTSYFYEACIMNS